MCQDLLWVKGSGLANHKAVFKGIPKEGIQWFNERAKELRFNGAELEIKTGLESTTTTSPYLYSTDGRSMSQEETVTASYSMSQDTVLPWCQDPVHGGFYMVPGCAYRLLGSDCPIVVSRDLLCCHMVFAYSSVVCRYVLPLTTAFIDVWGCISTLSVVVD